MCVEGVGVYTVYYLWHFGDSWNKVTLNSLHSLSRPFLSIITTLFTCWYNSSDTHTCIRKLGHHWFRQWLAAPSVPSHFLNEYIYIFAVNCNIRNKCKLNLDQNTTMNFEMSAKCKMMTNSSRSQWSDLSSWPLQVVVLIYILSHFCFYVYMYIFVGSVLCWLRHM